MYKLAVFDLDGTLLNTLEDLKNAVNYALRAFGFPERSSQEIKGFIGNGVIKLMERSTPDGTDEKTQTACLDAFRKYYLEHMADNTQPYEGVRELLLSLKEKGVRTAVVSNKLHSAVEGLCRDYFPSLIDEAIGVAEENERKPSPVNAVRAMKNSCCSKGETIFIGDSEVDVITARNAGIKCIGVTWGFRDEEELRRAGCDYISYSAQQTLKLITE